METNNEITSARSIPRQHKAGRGTVGNMGNGGESFAAEAEGGDLAQILEFLELGRGESFAHNRHILFLHQENSEEV